MTYMLSCIGIVIFIYVISEIWYPLPHAITQLLGSGALFGLVTIVISERHLRRRLRDAQFRLCLHCAYDLSAGEDSGICPECGNQYDVSANIKLWKCAMLKTHELEDVNR